MDLSDLREELVVEMVTVSVRYVENGSLLAETIPVEVIVERVGLRFEATVRKGNLWTFSVASRTDQEPKKRA